VLPKRRVADANTWMRNLCESARRHLRRCSTPSVCLAGMKMPGHACVVCFCICQSPDTETWESLNDFSEFYCHYKAKQKASCQQCYQVAMGALKRMHAVPEDRQHLGAAVKTAICSPHPGALHASRKEHDDNDDDDENPQPPNTNV
jgi:hypothetical protein